MDRPPARMRAAYITELGPAETIRIGELPVPAPGPADVLVRVELAAVAPVDLLADRGRIVLRVADPAPAR